jgi:energy-converting hydrogenase A subunit M
MKYVKIQNGIVTAISEQKIVAWMETNKAVEIGMEYDGTNFFFPSPTLEDGKKKIEVLLDILVGATAGKLNSKYSMLQESGDIELLKKEVIEYGIDATVVTPIIDRIANVNGRTREEEIGKIVGMQTFMSTLGDVQMAAMKAKERCKNTDDVDAVLAVLGDFASCQQTEDVKGCFVGKADANIEKLKVIGI